MKKERYGRFWSVCWGGSIRRERSQSRVILSRREKDKADGLGEDSEKYPGLFALSRKKGGFSQCRSRDGLRVAKNHREGREGVGGGVTGATRDVLGGPSPYRGRRKVLEKSYSRA